MPDQDKAFTASILAEVIDRELKPSAIGVVASALPSMDVEVFISELNGRLKKPIRLAILGGKPSGIKNTAKLTVTTNETKANSWRHDAEALEGRKLVVIAIGPVAKLRSLQSSLVPVTEAKIRKTIRDRAVEWNPVAARKALWNTVAGDFGRFPTALLCNFSAAVAPVAARGNKHDVLEYEVKNLFRLGLLKQAKLLEDEGAASVRKLITMNLALVDRLRSPTREDKARVGRVAENNQESLGQTARKVLEFMRGRQISKLDEIGFDEASRVVAPKATQSKKGDENTPPAAGKKEKRLGDELAVQDILETGGKNLSDLKEHFEPEPGEDPEEEFELGQRKIVPDERPGKSQTGFLLERFFTEQTFGAYVEASSAGDYVAALVALDAEETDSVREFRPTDVGNPEAFESLLEKIVRRGLPPESQDVLDVWKQYFEVRKRLLPHAAALVDHPLLALLQDGSLFETADQLIKAYGQVAQKVDSVRKAIEENSPEASKRLSSKFLSLDVVFMKLRANACVAVAGPTHAFHLWRWVETARLLVNDRVELGSIDQELVVKLASNPPVTSPHLLLTSQIEGVEKDTVFLAIGALATLPLYSDPQSRTAARLQGKGLADVLHKLLASAPHATKGCEIVAIDPPSVADLLAALEAAGEVDLEGNRVPLHIRVLRTRSTPALLEEEDASMDNLLVDIREAGGAVEVEAEQLTQDELVLEMEKRPAHFIIVFEPGDSHAFRVGLEVSPTLSPLVVPRSYKYDDIEDRFDVVIAGNETPFGGYYDLFCHLQNMPTRNTIGRRSGASSWLPFLGKLGKHALWFSIVDQGLEPTMRIENAVRLDKRFSGGRDIHTFTCHANRIDRTVRNVVQAAGLVPDDQVVQRTVGLMRRLGGNTVPAAMSTSLSGQPFTPHARGILGVLAVGAWHEKEFPAALLISLDSESARTWILGYDPEDRRRGDLLCLRQTQSGIHLEVIEVKVRDDSQSVYQIAQTKSGKLVKGYAIEQIDNVISVLKRILAKGNLNGVDRARREILRDQLYMAVATRDMDGADRGRADRLLQEFFRNGPNTISGRLLIVNLETNCKRNFPIAPAESGVSPAGNAVEVFLFVESDLPDDDGDGGSGTSSKDPSPVPPEAKDAKPAKKKKKPVESKPPTNKGSEAKAELSPVVEAPDNVQVFIGHDPAGKEILWNSAANPNFGFLVTGDSGMGKSQTIRAFIQALRQQKLPVLIFDFKNDYASADFAKPLGMKVYDVVRKGLPFNPLSLLADEHGEVQPIRQCHELAAIISRVEGLKEQQQNRLVEAQKRAYEKHGIEPRQRIPISQIKSEPVFDEVLKEMEEMDDNSSKTALFRLQKFSDLGLFPTGPSKFSFEELIQGGVVLTLNDSANDNLMRILAEILIVKFHALLKRGEQPRKLRRALVFDEAWRVAKSERLIELAREGRAFGVGLIIGSQFPDDLPENLVGSLRTQIFLHNKNPDMRKAVARVLCSASSGASAQRIIETLGSLPQFQGYLVSEEHKPWTRVNILPHMNREP